MRWLWGEEGLSAVFFRWLNVPLIVDPKTGQAWVWDETSTATIIAPALAGTALAMLAHALRSGTVPRESTRIAPESFPLLGELARTGKWKFPPRRSPMGIRWKTFSQAPE